MNAQFKKGVLEMVILFVISQEDTYGYELMKKIKLRFPETYEGTIYTIIRRLIQDKKVETYEGKITDGPLRKYIKITPNGKSHLQVMRDEWKALCDTIHQVGME